MLNENEKFSQKRTQKKVNVLTIALYVPLSAFFSLLSMQPLEFKKE